MRARAPARPGRQRSEEHTSELQSHSEISYAVFCLQKEMIAQGRWADALPLLVMSAGLAGLLLFGALALLVDTEHIFFFNDTATTEIYTLSYTLSLHDALPI